MTGRRAVGPSYLMLFASLYALQGAAIAYLFNFHKLYLKDAGHREDAIGLVQTLALLPMVFKFLVGPLSDRVNLFGMGHRRPFIALGLLLQTLGLFGLAVVDPRGSLPAFAALGILAVMGLAFYDTCCDGMVIDVTPPEGRARVQGLLWTARFLAATACTLGFGAWVDWLGGPSRSDRLLMACAGFSAVPIVLVLVLPEPPRAADAEAFSWSGLGALIRPRALALLAFGCLYSIAGMGVEANLSLYYDRLGLRSGADVGRLGALRNLGRAVGASLLPLGIARLGRKTTVTLGIVALGVTIAGQTWVTNRPAAGLLGFSFGAANGWDDALFAMLAMELSDPRMAASTFALFMAVTNTSVVGDALFARGVTVSGGYRVPLVGAAVLAFATIFLTGPLTRPASRPEPNDAGGG
jgi:PAT family beta-lactamase induction signal transducer AmpG